MRPLPTIKPTIKPLPAKPKPGYLGVAPEREITRAEWDNMPAAAKRRHKDGRRFFVVNMGGGKYVLQPVTWRR